MSFVSDWSTADGSVLMNFDSTVLDVFKKYRQLGERDLEAGGILLATVHELGFLVKEASAPTPYDIRRRNFFDRRPFWHRALAKRRWRASGGTVRYVGEWHTHPQDHPIPSILDRTEWRHLARSRVDGCPLLAVIVGRHSLHVELVSGNSRRAVMAPAG